MEKIADEYSERTDTKETKLSQRRMSSWSYRLQTDMSRELEHLEIHIARNVLYKIITAL